MLHVLCFTIMYLFTFYLYTSLCIYGKRIQIHTTTTYLITSIIVYYSLP